MRMDGFVAMCASGEIGTLITAPLKFEAATRLYINADADNFPPQSSWLRSSILDAQTLVPLEGFESENFDTITTDKVNHLARWRGKSDVSSLKDKVFRIKFEMSNTRLYSFTVK